MNSNLNPPAEPLADDIRAYAYHLYEQSGRQPGHELDHWLEAKACILANIPQRASHARLHHHLSGRPVSEVKPTGFTMPASDAALTQDAVVPRARVKGAKASPPTSRTPEIRTLPTLGVTEKVR